MTPNSRGEAPAERRVDLPGQDRPVGTGRPRRRRRSARRPWYVHELGFVFVLSVVAVGLVAVSFDYWRRGLLWTGCGLFGAAAVRLLLPTRKVGLLAVRGRPFDVLAYLVLGVAVVACTLAVPRPGAGS
jgi:hypothetical protein